MSTRSLKVLIAQLAPVANDVGANLERAVALLHRHREVDLAVFPELFLNGYSLEGLVPVRLAESVVLEQLTAAARAHATAIVIGLATEGIAVDDPPADAALCIAEDGSPAGSYHKTHLFGSEAGHFAAGDTYLVTELQGVLVAPIVCYDLEFPEPARAVAAAGAELLVTIAANMDPYGLEHEIFSRSRALENRLAHIYVNRVGEESGLRFCGGSAAVGSDGREIATLAAYEPEVRVLEVPVGRRSEPAYLAERRETLTVRHLTAADRTAPRT